MKVNLIVDAHEAKMLPPLSIILGQYQLPGQKICADINKLTEKFEQSLPISLSIVKVNATEYNIQIKGPTLAFLISQSSDSIKNVTIEILFDIFNFFKNKSIRKSIEKDIFSTLRSCQLYPIFLLFR